MTFFGKTGVFPKAPLAELRDPRVQQELQLKPDLLAALKALGANTINQGITDNQLADLLAALKARSKHRSKRCPCRPPE